MSLHRLTLLLLTLAALLAPVAGAQEAIAASAPQAGSLSEWGRLLRRDGRASFSPRTAHDALLRLEQGGLSLRERAAALFALGSAGELGERPRLESYAFEGEEVERRAAILALGELGVGVENTLLRILREESGDLQRDAILAFLRTGKPYGRKVIDQLIKRGGALGREASGMLLFCTDPLQSRANRSLRLFLDLRWEAAKEYGLVDGQAWSVHLVSRLCGNQSFLDQFVLLGAAEIRDFGVKDHLLNQLLEVGGDASLRACVRALPSELSQLLLHGLWQPSKRSDYELIMREIEGLPNSMRALGLAAQLAESKQYLWRSIAAISRAGSPDAMLRLFEAGDELEPADRRTVLDALGRIRHPQVKARLREQKATVPAYARMTLLIGLVRNDDNDAREALFAILDHPSDRNYEEVFRLACEHADSSVIADRLFKLLDSLAGEKRIRAAARLTELGHLGARAVLRGELGDRPPEGQLGLIALRALASQGAAQDLDLFRAYFPQEGRDMLNAELALILLREGDESVLPLLRAALWSDPFDRSILAGRLILELGGRLTLHDEIDRVPPGASSRDLRRLGFALGEWGGLTELRHLQRKRPGSGDPLLQGALLGALSGRTH